MKRRSKTESCNIQQCFNYNIMQRAPHITPQSPSCKSKKTQEKIPVVFTLDASLF